LELGVLSVQHRPVKIEALLGAIEEAWHPKASPSTV
jgi:hypothetical protein